jgi:hypothetical protein
VLPSRARETLSIDSLHSNNSEVREMRMYGESKRRVTLRPAVQPSHLVDYIARKHGIAQNDVLSNYN